MKKLKLFVTALFAMLLAVTSVHADNKTTYDITNTLASFLEITQEDSVKAGDYDIDKIHVVVKVDETSINSILGQKSGAGSSLGIFYFGLKPQGITGTNVNMEYSRVKKTSSYEDDLVKAATEAKATADGLAKESKYDSMRVFWNLAVRINYNKDGVWTPVTGEGDGATSIGDKLKELLDDDALSADDYGTKFIFSIPEDEVIVWVYREATSDSDEKYHYVTIDYDVEFPISASNGEDSYYYETVQDALRDVEKLGLTEITVNTTTEVDYTVEIPEGVSINVTKDGKITFNGNVRFDKGATLGGEGDIVFGTDAKKVYALYVTPSKNGYASIAGDGAHEGDQVTVKIFAEKGYELDKLVITDDNGKTIKFANGEFTMPASPVTITATFKKAVENPDTYDNVMAYVAFAGISMIGLVSALYLKKKAYN